MPNPITLRDTTFTPDGRWLVTTSQDGQLHASDLRWLYEQVSPARLLLMTQAASGRRLNEAGAIEAIPPREHVALVRRLHQDEGARKGPSP
jgi:hypothetical protein